MAKVEQLADLPVHSDTMNSHREMRISLKVFHVVDSLLFHCHQARGMCSVSKISINNKNQ